MELLTSAKGYWVKVNKKCAESRLSHVGTHTILYEVYKLEYLNTDALGEPSCHST